MDSVRSKVFVRRLFIFSSVSAFTTTVIGTMTLVGWLLESSVLKGYLPHSVPMNPLTAIFFILLGLCLISLRDRDRHAHLYRAGKILSTFSLGLISLHIVGSWGNGLRLDKFLFPSILGDNQMAPNTALCILVATLALVLIDFRLKNRREQHPFQILAVLVTFIALQVIVGYMYGSKEFVRSGSFFPMALNTALGLFGFGLGLLSLRANEGLMSLPSSHTAGGLMIRRLVVFVLLVPVTIGWFRVYLHNQGIYDNGFGTAIFTVLVISIFLAVCWWNAFSLNRLDFAFRSQNTIIHSILERIDESLIVMDIHGDIKFFNSSAEQLLGINMKDAVLSDWKHIDGFHYADTFSPIPSDQLPLNMALKGISTTDVEIFVRNARNPGGSFHLVTGRPIFNDHNEVVAGVTLFRDITKLKLEERRVRQLNQELEAHNIELTTRSHTAAKMASLGEMAAGVGHEINNPLTAILGSIDYLLEDVESDKPLSRTTISKILTKMKATALRMAKIVRSLKSFARDGSNDPMEECSMKKILEETAELCQEKIRYKDIDLMIDEVPDDLTLECRPTEVSQILLNLIGNAQDAIKASKEEKWIRVTVTDSEGWIQISVTDSGWGIPSEIREKIFQPFFTTKDVGVGTGLGLSISREMISGYGGSLEVDDTSVHTSFILRIPKHHKQAVAS